MARGGARSGAGRKKGTVSQQTREKRELAKRAAAEGVTPLDIMLTTMRAFWAEAQTGPVPNIGKRMQAVAIAEKVAPYIHPKLSNVQAKIEGEISGPGLLPADLSKLTIEQLQQLKAIHAALADPAGGGDRPGAGEAGS